MSSLSVLRHRAFRRLFVADALSQIGQNMLFVAYPTLLLEVTHDVTLTGLAFAGEILAYGLFSPWAGLAADRFEQKTLMTLANFGRAGLLFSLLGSLSRDTSLGFYLALSMLLGLCGALFTPARAAFLRRLLEGEELLAAAALEGTMMFLLRLVAPALIGIVVLLTDARVGIAFDACFYLASLMALAPSWVTGPWRGADRSSRRKLRAELAEGWRCIQSSEALRQLLLLDFCLSVVGMASWSTGIAFLETVAHVAAVNNGWLGAAMGLSGALGTRIGARWRARPVVLAGILTALAGCYLCLAHCHTFQGLVQVWFLRGLVVGAFVVLISQEIARQVPPELVGRVQAAWEQVSCLACFAGTLATPWLLRHGGAIAAFRLYAVIMVGVAGLWWISLGARRPPQ